MGAYLIRRRWCFIANGRFLGNLSNGDLVETLVRKYLGSYL